MYLRSQPTPGPIPRCRGFTIMEMVVATFLAALLALLLAGAAATFVRPAGEVDGRIRLALEASMAAEALARDLGGYLADNSGVPGTLTQYQFSNWIPANGSLVLIYQGINYQGIPLAPASVSVTYLLQNSTLVRTLSNPVESVVVASHVTGFNASLCNPDGTPNSATGTCVMIQITLTYPDPPSNRLPSFSATYVLIGVQPYQLPSP